MYNNWSFMDKGDKVEEKCDRLIFDFKKSLGDIKEYRKSLTEEVSRLDSTVAEYYHLFENGSFPANVSSQLLKQFRICLKERRKVKEEALKIQSLHDIIKARGFSTQLSDIKNTNPTYYCPKYLKEEFKKYAKYIDFEIRMKEQK